MRLSRALSLAVPAFLAAMAGPAHAEWYGNLTDLSGVVDTDQAPAAEIVRTRLTGGWNHDFSAQWRLEAGGQGDWTKLGPPGVAASTLDGEAGRLWAEGQRSSADGSSLYSARLERLFLKFTEARWEVSAGRVPVGWGDSKVYQPTRIFHAPSPLEAFRDPQPGNDGWDAVYTLWPNTKLEAAQRWLRDGHSEWVVRMENQGIGFSGTPLYARREGEDGIGAELSATFRRFQCRLEGVGWHPLGGSGRPLEWVAGFSTAYHEFPIHIEYLWDGTGRVFGPAATDPGARAGYLSVGIETPNYYRLRWNPKLVRSPGNGRLLAEPGLLYEFSKHLELGLGGQWTVGRAAGPLGNLPRKLWVYADMKL